MPEISTVLIPNILQANVDEVERLYERVQSIAYADQYMFDMRLVNFVNPYGVLALVLVARCLSARSGSPVRLANLATNVHLYLHRINLFEVGYDWLRPSGIVVEPWFHNPHSTNLLELTPVTGMQSVAIVLERAERIFSRWLKTSHLGQLLSVLSELCANIYQHSGDSHGCVLMQKYDMVTRNQVALHLAVGDLGCGIRNSLLTRYEDLGSSPVEYLHYALQGRTSRSSGRGGLGLRFVEQIATTDGGFLWLRSETSALLRTGTQTPQEWDQLIVFPGTQLAVKLCMTES